MCASLEARIADNKSRLFIVEVRPENAPASEQLFGSRVKAGSHYTEFKGSPYWYDAASGGFGTAQVVSESLFSVKKSDGTPLWSYRDGAILNSSIAIGGGRVYFVECRGL